MTRYVAGLDLGSTSLKLLIAPLLRLDHEVVVVQRPTPWRSRTGGLTELDADDLIEVLADLLAAGAAHLVEVAGPDARVEALAASGMGETGFVVDAAGHASAPAVAWFDPRGEEELKRLSSRFGDEFAARTGLPAGVQVSVVKLAHLAASGHDLRRLQWLNLPDFVVAAMGAEVAADLSLTSRTGLIDQDSTAPWREMLDWLGVGEGFLPPLLEAGTARGIGTAAWLPPAFQGSALCVAGHDHLVSAVAAGAVSTDRYHGSLGTAEVLLRVLEQPLEPDARVRLAGYFINCVRHVLPGRWVLVAGVKTGLLQRRALQLAGITDRPGRDRLDDEVMALPLEGRLAAGGVAITGAANDDGVLSISITSDGVTPAELFGAVLRHGNDELRVLLDALDRELPPPSTTILTGGWAHMRSVHRARSAVLPGVNVSDREQDTAHGAARFAFHLATASAAKATD